MRNEELDAAIEHALRRLESCIDGADAETKSERVSRWWIEENALRTLLDRFREQDERVKDAVPQLVSSQHTKLVDWLALLLMVPRKRREEIKGDWLELASELQSAGCGKWQVRRALLWEWLTALPSQAWQFIVKILTATIAS